MHNAERGRNENRLGTLTVTPVTTIFRRDYHLAGSLRFFPVKPIRIDRHSMLSAGCDKESVILSGDFIENELGVQSFIRDSLN